MFAQVKVAPGDALEVWLQRPDASGARTPPMLSSDNAVQSLTDAQLAGLKDSLGSLASLSLTSLGGSGGEQQRTHEITPPDSPRQGSEPGGGGESSTAIKQLQPSVANAVVGAAPNGTAGGGVAVASGSVGAVDGGEEPSPTSDDEDAEQGRSLQRFTAASIGSDLRTPPDSPRAGDEDPVMQIAVRSLSPRVQQQMQQQQNRRTLKASSESSSVATVGSPSSPAFRWGEPLLISPEARKPVADSSLWTLRPEPRFNLIDSNQSSESMTMSGQHMAEIGFERSEKELGSGAYGKVWLGLRDNGEFLAIKEIHLPRGEKYAERLEAVENEIELMRNLDHPHIVRYLGSKRDEARGAFYILLEYVSCGSIQALLKTMGRPLDERVIRKYARQILLGLSYLHSRDPPVVHRDIKSANVLVETTGNVKLADFGCSKVVLDLLEGTRDRSVLGTPHWMAPEVIRGEGAGLGADIWSFGCTVLEMATGHPPWSHIRDPTAVMFHVASSNELPIIPEGLSDTGKDFLRLCFQRDPSKRPTAEQLLMHPFVSSDVVVNSSLRDMQNSEEYFNSLVTQSLSTMPQFLSVLPANLVVYIFQFLSLDDLLSVSAVCRQWRAASQVDSLWEVKAKEAWPWLDTCKGNRWRDVYRQGVHGSAPWKASSLMLDTLRGHTKAVLCVEMNGDNLATGGDDKKIRIWSLSKRKCLTTLRGHTKPVMALRLVGDRVLSGGADGAVRLWDIAKVSSWKCIKGKL